MTRADKIPDDEIARLRVPPHSEQAEQAVLGSLLLDPLCFDSVSDLVAASDFYRHEHRTIFTEVSAVILAGRGCDVITAFQRLQDKRVADDVGGLPYLNALAQSVPSAANARRYAEIVREKSILRRLIAASDEIATAAFNPQGRAPLDLLHEAEARILSIQHQRGVGSGYVGVDKLTVQVLDRLSDLQERGGGDIVGVSTGFRDLDRRTLGFEPGDLLVLAARPSMGKTALAMNIAENVAVKQGLPVGVFSMEMGGTQIVTRMAGAMAEINQHRMRTGNLRDEQWGRLSDAVDKLSKANMFIDESPGLSIDELRSRARRMRRDAGGSLSLVVVDYLQLMSGSSGRRGKSDENRATEIGEISRGLKGMAKELHCPVLALSQLNRSVESRNDKRPQMSDLRESGAIEQDADVIMFIYRDDYYHKETSKEPGIAEIIFAKQRMGPVGTERLGWQGNLGRFGNVAEDYNAKSGAGFVPAAMPEDWN